MIGKQKEVIQMRKQTNLNKDELDGIEKVYSMYFIEESQLEVF